MFLSICRKHKTPLLVLITLYHPTTGGESGSKTGIEKMMESMESGDAGGLPIVRPGDASKCFAVAFAFGVYIAEMVSFYMHTRCVS